MDRSPIEVAVLVIAGLIDGCERRAEAMAPLSVAVVAAVDELDPDHQRDTSATWWHDLDPWARLDALDRLRLSHDNLLALEVQASEIVMGLRQMLAPHPAAGFTYREDHGRLCRMADARGLHLNRMRLAQRQLVRPQRTLGGRSLSSLTNARLSGARTAFVEEERRGVRQRDRLARLLSMADLVVAS